MQTRHPGGRGGRRRTGEPVTLESWCRSSACTAARQCARHDRRAEIARRGERQPSVAIPSADDRAAGARLAQRSPRADFFSFGQRPDADHVRHIARRRAGFIGTRSAASSTSPFATLDTDGVTGVLVRVAANEPQGDLAWLGICGEHGGDPPRSASATRSASDTVSCSPPRACRAARSPGSGAAGSQTQIKHIPAATRLEASRRVRPRGYAV
jgi:hypothetical protein